MKKFIAFTLAETLIVMGIIGVVSALTLPNLNSSTGEKEKVAKVKKIYQNINDAVGRAEAVYGPMSEWFINDTNDAAKKTRFGERITEFMKVSKNCKNSTGCFSNNITNYNGTAYDGGCSEGVYSFILGDGTSMVVTTAYPGTKVCFDIDGVSKGKNKMLTDIFEVFIDSGTNTDANIHLGSISGDFDYNYGTAWVIMNDNMDYLKCEDKLDWETKTSCK